MRARVKDEGRQGRKIGRATQRAGSEFSDPPEQDRDYDADSIPTRESQSTHFGFTRTIGFVTVPQKSKIQGCVQK